MWKHQVKVYYREFTGALRLMSSTVFDDYESAKMFALDNARYADKVKIRAVR